MSVFARCLKILSWDHYPAASAGMIPFQETMPSWPFRHLAQLFHTTTFGRFPRPPKRLRFPRPPPDDTSRLHGFSALRPSPPTRGLAGWNPPSQARFPRVPDASLSSSSHDDVDVPVCFSRTGPESFQCNPSISGVSEGLPTGHRYPSSRVYGHRALMSPIPRLPAYVPALRSASPFRRSVQAPNRRAIEAIATRILVLDLHSQPSSGARKRVVK
jgi:hypothetical protein